jgi:hypothetical protein
MAMRGFFLVFTLLCASAVHAQAIDADSCENAARDLESAASDVEDAARDLQNEAVRNMRNAESRVRNASSNVISRANDVARNCGGFHRLTKEVILQSLRQYLAIRHGNTESVATRIRELQPELEFVARSHLVAQPVDFRQSYVLASLLFEHAPAASSTAPK